jgi:hypothetical protein
VHRVQGVVEPADQSVDPAEGAVHPVEQPLHPPDDGGQPGYQGERVGDAVAQAFDRGEQIGGAGHRGQLHPADGTQRARGSPLGTETGRRRGRRTNRSTAAASLRDLGRSARIVVRSRNVHD